MLPSTELFCSSDWWPATPAQPTRTPEGHNHPTHSRPEPSTNRRQGNPWFSLLLSLFPFRSLIQDFKIGSMSLGEQAKRKAAHAAVDDYIAKRLQNVDEEAPLVVGIGSGSTIVYAVERLIEIVGEAKKAH